MKYLLLFIFLTTNLYARPIEIRVRDYGWITSFPVVRDVLDFYLQEIENDINDQQPVLNPKRLNYGTANSTVLAAKGLGTDYVNEPEEYLISLGVGAAWDGQKNEALKDEISGVGGATSLSVGKKLKDRLMGFVNIGTLKHNQNIPGDDIDIAGDIETFNLGFHARYDLVQKQGTDFWGWGGIKVHVGYEYSRNDVDLSTDLDEPLLVDSGGQGIIEGRLTGKPTFEVKTITHSIPLEVSSNVLFLNIFSAYGGLGADYNYGESVGKGKTKGDFTTLACTSGACVGETVLPQLEVQANYDAKSQVKDLTFRAFGGLQMDLPMNLHVFGQVEQILGTKVIGLNTGLKYSF